MAVQPWREVSREEIFRKYGRGIDRVVFAMPDGKEREYYLKTEGNSVCVLALTPQREVVLARQFRPGPQEIVMELPGGALDDGEEPVQAAARELLEETGYAGDIAYVGSVLVDGYSPRSRHICVATDCRNVAAQNLDDGEFVDVLTMSLADFRQHLQSGRLTDTDGGYRALDFLGLL